MRSVCALPCSTRRASALTSGGTARVSSPLGELDTGCRRKCRVYDNTSPLASQVRPGSTDGAVLQSTSACSIARASCAPAMAPLALLRSITTCSMHTIRIEGMIEFARGRSPASMVRSTRLARRSSVFSRRARILIFSACSFAWLPKANAEAPAILVDEFDAARSRKHA